MRVTGWLVLLLLAGAAEASGQDRLFINGRELGALGHFGDDLGRAPEWVNYQRFGGDHYVYVPRHGVVDLRTGVARPLGEGWLLAFDRARPHAFLARDGGIWQEDVTTSWSLLILPRLEGLTSCVHATSADLLVCAFRRPDGLYDLVRSSWLGPTTVATVRFASSWTPFEWLITPDGSAVYLSACVRASAPSFCAEHDIARVDVATGAVTRGGAGLLDGSSPALVWDEVRDRLFVRDSRIHVFSKDLVHLGSANTGGRCRDIALSPHTGRLYLAVFDHYFSAGWTTLSAYDASSYAVLAGPRERPGYASCGTVTLVTAPGAPRDLRANVSGSTVQLSWTNIGAASSFVADVGYAPGRTDLSVPLGADPQTVFTGVPPGRYYVRIRGGNIHGGGRPSAEAVVVVR